MSVDRLAARSGGVIGTIGPIRGSGVFSLQERYALTADNYEDVSLYLKMNGANGSTTFYDSSLYGHTVTANGNAQISTAQSKFGGASAAFDGTGDYLTVPSSAAFAFGTGDFTIEAWVYPTATKTIANAILDTCPINGSGFRANAIIFYISPTNKLGAFQGDTSFIQSSEAINLNTWTHVAITRSGTSVKLWINGVNDGTATNGFDATEQGGNVAITADIPTNTDGHFSGYIDDLRITKGVARYTGNFTPPQREFRP